MKIAFGFNMVNITKQLRFSSFVDLVVQNSKANIKNMRPFGACGGVHGGALFLWPFQLSSFKT